MFGKYQLERYSRQLLLPGVGASGQQKLLRAKVLVVGAGGLGAPALLYLAAAGVGTLGIVDDDTVELSNLQRQILYSVEALGAPKTQAASSRLSALNPEVRVVTHQVRLDAENVLELLAPYDLILDGSDSLSTRYLVSDAAVLLGKPFVYGALAPFEGQFALLHTVVGAEPCYRCLYPELPPAGSVQSCAEAGVLGALPGVIGSLMATEALKHLLGLAEGKTKLTHYDALSGSFRTVGVRRNPACSSCGDAPSIHAPTEGEVPCRVV